MSSQPPLSAAVERAVRLVAADASVTAVRELRGGIHARTTLITTVHPELEVVLREFPAGDDAGSQEAHVLRSLAGLGGLAPQLLAEGTSTAGDGSWLVITRLPGVADITPEHPSLWAEQLGQALARIHATSLSRLGGFSSVFSRAGGSQADLSGPAAGVVHAGWEQLASQPHVLTHYDFWSGNAIWEHGALTGIVDWSGGGLGPRCFDIGWCRLDLYLLHGERIADKFLDAYQAASQYVVPNTLLGDLWAVARSHEAVETWVPNYHDLGRTDLTAAELRSRHSAWTELLLARTPAG